MVVFFSIPFVLCLLECIFQQFGVLLSLVSDCSRFAASGFCMSFHSVFLVPFALSNGFASLFVFFLSAVSGPYVEVVTRGLVFIVLFLDLFIWFSFFMIRQRVLL